MQCASGGSWAAPVWTRGRERDDRVRPAPGRNQADARNRIAYSRAALKVGFTGRTLVAGDFHGVSADDSVASVRLGDQPLVGVEPVLGDREGCGRIEPRGNRSFAVFEIAHPLIRTESMMLGYAIQSLWFDRWPRCLLRIGPILVRNVSPAVGGPIMRNRPDPGLWSTRIGTLQLPPSHEAVHDVNWLGLDARRSDVQANVGRRLLRMGSTDD